MTVEATLISPPSYLPKSSRNLAQGMVEVRRPRPALLPAPNPHLHQHPLRNPNTSRCRSASWPQRPGAKKVTPPVPVGLYPEHLKATARPSWHPQLPSVGDGRTYAPEGPAGPPGSLSEEEEDSCVWDLNGSRPAGEAGKLRGEYQAPPRGGPLQLKAASAPLNPIKGRYYVSGNVCQS